MSKFVNYKKRSFTLPPGCKNLSDVLAPSRQQTKGTIVSCGFPRVEIKEDRVPSAGLAQVERYVSIVIASRAELFTLSVAAHGFQFPVTLYRSRIEQMFAIVLVLKEAHQERAVRTYFEQQGLDAIYDQSDVDTPDATRCLAFPLPVDVARATSVTIELLRRVYGLSEEAGLDFRYYEMEKAA